MEKDLGNKSLFDCPDVFADVGNVNLFDGEPVIRPEQLVRLPQESFYRDNYGRLREHCMDCRMKVEEQGVAIAILCLENQAGVCDTMPVRELGYIYTNYSEQLRHIRQEKENGTFFGPRRGGRGTPLKEKLIPVIPLVIYYGQEEWDGPEELSQLLALPEDEREKWEPWILNHRIHLVHVPAQGEQVRKKYQSDFRHIADCLACAGDGTSRRKQMRELLSDPDRTVRHPEEFLNMMAAFCGENTFPEGYQKSVRERHKKEGGGEISMGMLAEVMNEIAFDRGVEKGEERGRREGFVQGEERGRKEGFAQGEERGRKEGFAQGEKRGRREGLAQGEEKSRRELVSNMLQDNQTPEDISRMTRQPLEYVLGVQEALLVHEEGRYRTDGKPSDDE